MLPLCRALALARYVGRVDSRPEMGVLELLTTTSITSETGNARRFVRGDDPGLASDPVLLGDNEKNLVPSAPCLLIETEDLHPNSLGNTFEPT
jgi:hypothetical protein